MSTIDTQRIPLRSKGRIAALLEDAIECSCHDNTSYYRPVSKTAKRIAEMIAQQDTRPRKMRAKITLETSEAGRKMVIHHHDQLWYEVTLPDHRDPR